MAVTREKFTLLKGDTMQKVTILKEDEEVIDLSYVVLNSNTLRSAECKRFKSYETLQEAYVYLMVHVNWMIAHNWKKIV